MKNSIALAVVSALVGACITFLILSSSEREDALYPTGIAAAAPQENGRDAVRRIPKEKAKAFSEKARLTVVVRELQKKIDNLNSALSESKERAARLQNELKLGDDILPEEPALGLTALQEFRIGRRLSMGKESVLEERRKEWAKNGRHLIQGPLDETATNDIRRRSRSLGSRLKQSKRDALIREFGEEKAMELAKAALEQKNQFLAPAKSENERTRMQSHFNEKNRISSALIKAFMTNY
ncbi:MAG: hypothetical protein ACI97A_004427 [Planctomycetota bacterium]|jgi:hypothetical protein